MTIECWDANGTRDYIWQDNGWVFSRNDGGKGGYVKGTFEGLDNKTLYIHVAGLLYNGTNSGSGGEASYVTLESGGLASFKDKKDKVLLVAGGGGGASRGVVGGAGGTGGDYQFGKAESASVDGGGGGQGWKVGTAGKDADENSSGTGVTGGKIAQGGTNKINTESFTVTNTRSKSGERAADTGRVKITYTPCQHTNKTETVVTQPTCTEEGKRKYTCNKCGTEWEETMDALGHDEPVDFSYTDNNSISNGEKYKNCRRCGIRLATEYKVVLSAGKGITAVSGEGYYEAGSYVSIDATVQTDWTFENWTGGHSSTTKADTFTMPGNAVSAKANAYPDFIGIVYDKHVETTNKYGDTVTSTTNGDIKDQKINRNESSTIKQNATTAPGDTAYTRTGYRFVNWNTKADGTGTTYNPGDSISYTGLYATYDKQWITLYAQWEPIVYSIRYNGNGNWNTGQGSYLQESIRYDQSITLISNKFSRSDNTTYNGEHYRRGYEFIGWGEISNQATKDYSDRATLKNLTSTAGTFNLYALWKKNIELTFNLNGGTYKGSSSNILLKGTIWNSQKTYDFSIENDEITEESMPLWSKQTGTIDAYGEVIDNGLNSLYTKYANGIQYRFIGWSTDANASTPDTHSNKLICPYETGARLSKYSTRDTTTLYAVWEEVMNIHLTLDRSLGTLKFDSGATVKNSLKNITVSSPSQSDKTVSTIIKSGEEGYYRIDTANSSVKMVVAFDSDITKIYESPDKYTDDLNKKDDEAVLSSQKHGLNRKVAITKGSTSRNFHMPIYLAERNTNDSGTKNAYAVKFEFNKPSYYYNKVFGTDETATVLGVIYITDNGSTDGTNITGVLDELRTELHVRVQN